MINFQPVVSAEHRESKMIILAEFAQATLLATAAINISKAD